MAILDPFPDYKKTQRKLIPWAWMASEYLKTGDFNIKSDVWSFGVVLWEIFTVGNKPYGISKSLLHSSFSSLSEWCLVLN